MSAAGSVCSLPASLGTPSADARLSHFPVSFFAVVMGLAGLAIAWHKAQMVFSLPIDLGTPLLMLAAGIFCVLLALYLTKLVRHRAAVAAELGHPIHLNFFPTISVSLLLLAIGTLPHWPGVAGLLWILGSALHLLLTLYVMSVWIHHEHFEIHHINPAWFIPIVGNVLVPIAGVPLGFAEVGWFYFSVGILFWLILFAIIVYRMLFHRPLAERLMPTFFILIAPPAVGFIAYLQLTGGLDPFARGGHRHRHPGHVSADRPDRLRRAGLGPADPGDPGGGLPAGAYGRRRGGKAHLRPGPLRPNPTAPEDPTRETDPAAREVPDLLPGDRPQRDQLPQPRRDHGLSQGLRRRPRVGLLHRRLRPLCPHPLLVFCFGIALPDPHVLAVRPRSIGVAETTEGFLVTFMEAPMPVANTAMEAWAKGLRNRADPSQTQSDRTSPQEHPACASA